MVDKKKSSDQNTTTKTVNTPDEQNLSDKTHAQLKRETRARLRHLDSESAAELLDEVRRPVGGTIHNFADFLREHAIVGLAVGFVLGAQVQALANQLIKSFLDPMLLLLTGDDLTSRQFVLTFNGNKQAFHWGMFVSALIDFLLVVGVLYVIIKVLKLEKLDKKS
ncbi:MAG TPA: MscL family protein [Candidatus Saccharimonadales bacterium]|nr:MscL family protein [Candidatus Saccharimonadales bacterium]